MCFLYRGHRIQIACHVILQYYITCITEVKHVCHIRKFIYQVQTDIHIKSLSWHSNCMSLLVLQVSLVM